MEYVRVRALVVRVGLQSAKGQCEESCEEHFNAPQCYLDGVRRRQLRCAFTYWHVFVNYGVVDFVRNICAHAALSKQFVLRLLPFSGRLFRRIHCPLGIMALARKRSRDRFLRRHSYLSLSARPRTPEQQQQNHNRPFGS